jgi:hypothetical protein
MASQQLRLEIIHVYPAQKFQLTPDSASEFFVVAVPFAFAFALLATLELVDLGIW